MQSKTLRPTIIKASLVLIVFSLLVYFTASSPERSVWGALGQVILTFLQTIQFGIGLTIGLLLCLAVLIGIFLGGVALVSPRAATVMYEGLRTTIKEWTKPLWVSVVTWYTEKLAILRQDISAPLQEELRQTQRTQAVLQQRLQTLESTATTLQATVRGLASSEQLLGLAEQLNTTSVTMGKIQEALDTIGDEIIKSGKQVLALEGQMQQVPGQLTSLEQQLETLSSEVAALQTAPQGGATEEGASRIFNYIEDGAAHEQLVQLVGETLGKEMSYAQVMGHLESNLAPETAKIIAEHPALMKDYIRFCRKNEQ